MFSTVSPRQHLLQYPSLILCLQLVSQIMLLKMHWRPLYRGRAQQRRERLRRPLRRKVLRGQQNHWREAASDGRGRAGVRPEVVHVTIVLLGTRQLIFILTLPLRGTPRCRSSPQLTDTLHAYSGIMYTPYNHTIRSTTPKDDIQSERGNDSKKSGQNIDRGF